MADAVLATLGYTPPQQRSGTSVRKLALYGAAAMAVGFAGLSALILLIAPSTPKPVTATAARSSSPARAGGRSRSRR